jgi:four helix bundle protein
MTYEEWLSSVPEEFTADPVWHMNDYRQALFLGELCWFDASKLVKDFRTRDLSDQLYRAVGGITTNVCEGFSRSSGKDQARFYEYALGSAREARDWYYKGRHILSDEVAMHRTKLIVHIIRQLLTLIPVQRGYKIREEHGLYQDSPDDQIFSVVPMPFE